MSGHNRLLGPPARKQTSCAASEDRPQQPRRPKTRDGAAQSHQGARTQGRGSAPAPPLGRPDARAVSRAQPRTRSEPTCCGGSRGAAPTAPTPAARPQRGPVCPPPTWAPLGCPSVGEQVPRVGCTGPHGSARAVVCRKPGTRCGAVVRGRGAGMRCGAGEAGPESARRARPRTKFSRSEPAPRARSRWWPPGGGGHGQGRVCVWGWGARPADGLVESTLTRTDPPEDEHGKHPRRAEPSPYQAAPEKGHAEKGPRSRKVAERRGSGHFPALAPSLSWSPRGPEPGLPSPPDPDSLARARGAVSKGHFLWRYLPSRGSSADPPRRTTSSVRARSGHGTHPPTGPADPGRGWEDTLPALTSSGGPPSAGRCDATRGARSSPPPPGATGA